MYVIFFWIDIRSRLRSLCFKHSDGPRADQHDMSASGVAAHFQIEARNVRASASSQINEISGPSSLPLLYGIV